MQSKKLLKAVFWYRLATAYCALFVWVLGVLLGYQVIHLPKEININVPLYAVTYDGDRLSITLDPPVRVDSIDLCRIEFAADRHYSQ